MRKLKLDVDALDVESFDVAGAETARGTVAAAGAEYEAVEEHEVLDPDLTQPTSNACPSSVYLCGTLHITCNCPTADIGCVTMPTGCGTCLTGVPNCCT